MPWMKLWSSAASKNTTVEEEQTALLKDQSKSSARETTYLTHLNSQPAPSSTRATGTLQSLTQPETILATVILTTACLGGLQVYKKYLRRIPEATNIHASFFRRRSVFGKVTSVGDGDNFRIYHTPGGRFAGWGWIPGRKVPTDRKELKNQTIHVRIAGVDAPELPHFGRPAQPYSPEALDWLTKYVLGRRVRAYVYKQDQYSRVVATVYVWKGFFRRDVGLQMLRSGLATVYEAKSGAEFGDGLEPKYRNAERWAKTKKKGMWAGNQKDFESPREYKNRHSNGPT